MRATSVIWLLLFTTAALADISIEELVREAGIKEGSTPMSDTARWHGARKILLRRVSVADAETLRDLLPDAEIVIATSDDDALDKVSGVDAIIGTCDAQVIAAAEKLVWVQIFWAGAESCLAVPQVGNGEVILTNMQKMSSPVIGEHAVAMAMALARGLPVYAKDMQTGESSELYTTSTEMVSLTGKTMLVIGLGGIGTEAARRGAALGMRVIATRNSRREGPPFVEYVGLSDELLELAGQADVIVNALPLTPSTRGLLDGEFFAATRKGAFFVNVGRGGTVSTDALVAALQQGQIAGAGLDVTDPEPLPRDHPLWSFDNVIITPHVAGRGGGRGRHMTLLRENLRRYAAGEPLLNVVDPSRGY